MVKPSIKISIETGNLNYSFCLTKIGQPSKNRPA